MWWCLSLCRYAAILSLLSIFTIVSANEDPLPDSDLLLLRKITPGIIRGRKIVTPRTGVTGYGFFSIPIAEPPIGNLRFRRPVPRQPWNGVLDATDYKNSCYWNSTITHAFTNDYNMSEDCISVNVFTNAHCLSNGGCAVAFYIHGGYFAFGTPLQFSPDMLIENFANSSRNVIMVTVGFRAAAFAGLNFNHKLDLSIDLNVGGHDLIHGLRWVQDEIHAFGGNPNKVTLMGHSGGATIVNQLAVSPLGGAGTLFHQMIAMSRGLGDQDILPDNLERVSRSVAKHVGCAAFDIDAVEWEDVKTVEDVIDCLRKKPAIELSAAQPIYEPMDLVLQGFVRDRGDHALFPYSYNVLAALRTPIPTLTGTVSKEWLQTRDAIVNVFTVDKSRMWEYCRLILKMLDYAASETAIEACLNEYSTASRAIYAYDDAIAYVNTIELANNMITRGGDVFLYEFAYEGIGNAYISGEGLPQPPIETYPGHSHELIYLMGQHLGNFTAKDYEIQYLFSQIFVDFINKGSPNTTHRNWNVYDPLLKNYFKIDYPDPTLKSPGMRKGYHKEAYAFWDDSLPLLAGDKHEKTTETQVINPTTYFDNHPFPNSCPAEATVVPQKSSFNANFKLLFFIAVGIIIFLTIVLLIALCFARRRDLQYDSL